MCGKLYRFRGVVELQVLAYRFRSERAGLEAVGVAIALGAALIRGSSDVHFSLEHDGGVHEDFGDSWEGVQEAVVEKKIDGRIIADRLASFFHDPKWEVETTNKRAWTLIFKEFHLSTASPC
jgi:hypothetical protein